LSIFWYFDHFTAIFLIGKEFILNFLFLVRFLIVDFLGKNTFNFFFPRFQGVKFGGK